MSMWEVNMDQKEVETTVDINPLFNPLILQNVIRRLDNRSLKDARLVCQLWNEEAVPILMMRSCIKLKADCEIYRDDMGDGCLGVDHNYNNGRFFITNNRNHYLERLECDKLMDTLDQSPNPEVMFQNAHLDFALLKNVKFLGVLKKYGHLLKSAVVRKCQPITHVNQDESGDGHGWLRGKDEMEKYLGPLLTEYCLNLLYLMVEVEGDEPGVDEDDEDDDDDDDDDDNENEDDDEGETSSSMKIPKLLNLEQMEIIGVHRGPPDEYELNFLLEVIKASPKLKQLNVTAAGPFPQSLSFCKNVSALEVIKNLEKFGWRFAHDIDHPDNDTAKQDRIMEMFEVISKMEMKKLKILSLNNLTVYNSKMMSELLDFFQRNGTNLSILTLRDVGINFDGKDNLLLFSTLEFQQIFGFCPSIGSIHIESSPNRFSWLIDLDSLNLKPYSSLAKLFLSNYILKNLGSFKAIVKWFPNLVCLNLDNVQFRDWYSRRTTSGPRFGVIDVIKSMKSLQRLQELDLRLSVHGDLGFEDRQAHLLGKVIEAAQNIPGLKFLTVIHVGVEEDRFTSDSGDLRFARALNPILRTVRMED